MDAGEVLSKAWQAVQSSGVPESLYSTAFKEAVEILKSAKAPAAARDGIKSLEKESKAATPGEVETPEGAPIDADALVAKLAQESQITEDELAEAVFFDPNGASHLNVAARKLGDTTTVRAQAVATMLTGVAFFGHDQNSIPAETVRLECIRLGCYDKKNFYRHMSSVPGAILSGSGSSRVLRAKPADIRDAMHKVVNLARGVKA